MKRLSITCVLAAIMSSVCSADEPEVFVRFKDGSTIKGTISPRENVKEFALRCRGFQDDLIFDWQSVHSLLQTTTGTGEPKLGDTTHSFQLELANGEQVVGRLLSMDRQMITIQSASLGELRLLREYVQSIFRLNTDVELLYSTHHDDGKWHAVQNEEDWEKTETALSTNVRSASICGHVDLPEKSQITLHLSWEGQPNFTLALGTEQFPNGKAPPDASEPKTQFEVWDSRLVLVREADKVADVAFISELTRDMTQIELAIFFDQKRGTVAAKMNREARAKVITVDSGQIGSAITITNHGTSLKLHSLQVHDWDGTLPEVLNSESPAIVDNNGNAIAGVVQSFDEAAQEFIVLGGDEKPTRIAASNLRAAKLGDAGNRSAENHAASNIQQSVALALTDGTSLRGQWQENSSGRFHFKSDHSPEPVSFAPEFLRVVNGSAEIYQPSNPSTKVGKLTIGDSQLNGYFLPDSTADAVTGLLWQPSIGRNASEISSSASGRIFFQANSNDFYRTRMAIEAAKQRQLARRNLVAPALAEPPTALGTNVQDWTVSANEIRFRNGDSIEGTLQRISESGINFQSAQTTSGFATHDQIESITLVPLATSDLSADKRKRLLAVPRSMKNDPPTHLIVSKNGDYLRGRLVGFAGDKLTLEVRSEPNEFPISEISQIIWLDRPEWIAKSRPSENDSDEGIEGANLGDDESSAELNPFEVHTVAGDGRRLTIEPRRMANGRLEGTSQLLGETSVAIADIVQLLFGRNIEEQVSSLQTKPWELTLAPYPRVYLDEDNTSGSSSSSVSPMVGTDAPDFKLTTVDGETFRLSENRDKIIVLDFWASWCGPCISSMPKLHAAIQEINSDSVLLLPVNVQETSERVRLGLERMKLECDSLLDKDGEVGAAYSAVAIPQTVIIDRSGKITNVFIGTGPKFIEEFRGAIMALLEN